MYQTKNLGLNITEIDKDKLQPFSFKLDLGDNFEAIDAKTLSHRNITNCLLEIPQDIKLELIDGTLTLKEGSKVYVPNGFEADGVTKKFDVVEIESDITKISTVNATTFLCFDITLNTLRNRKVAESYSGNTKPTSTTYAYWYDTTNNRIGVSEDGGVTWTYGCSLPLAILTESITQITSIDQVFNGFGYIGSTVFALPGVKGLCTNGRNTDLTLKHTNLTVSKVILGDWGAEGSNGSAYCIIKSNNTLGKSTAGFELSKNGNLFDKSVGNAIQGFVFAKIESTNGTIKNLNPYYPFRAVDYNDYQTKITELETKIATLEAAVQALQG